MFNVRKMASNVGVYAGLLAAGDFICQQLEMQSSHSRKIAQETGEEVKWDKTRTRNFLLTGVPVGVISHWWYTWLDKRMPGVSAAVIARKIAGDQGFFTPLFYLSIYSSYGTLEGRSVSDWFGELRSKFLVLYATDWFYWPPVQAINFYFVHPKFRVVYVSVAMLCWNIWLSFSKTHELSFTKIKKVFTGN